MDAKDLRTATALGERDDDGNKYAQSGTIQCNKYKPYQDIASNSSVKVDSLNSRPCAVIGPDRVVPPSDLSDAYFKKVSVEPWPCQDNTYYRPPEYVQKVANYQSQTRNISPRQTFQENMQRIMVAPTYNSVKMNDNTTYHQSPDRNIPLTNNSKMNISSDSKYCDVPYTIIPTNNNSKTLRNAELSVPCVNPNIARSASNAWPPSSIHARQQKPYASSELYSPYPEYPSCAGPRHVALPRPQRTIPEEPGCMFSEPYYHESNIRFKPYPNIKEKYQQSRYDYINNYSNPFHPPPFLSHKYDLHQPVPPHPYPGYPHIKYIDSRIPEPIFDGFQRSVNHQNNYSVQYRNQGMHPTYGAMMPNCSQGNILSHPSDSSNKSILSNKLPYDNNNKMYVNYENTQFTPAPDNLCINETSRMHSIKSHGIMPNFTPMMNTIPHPYYKKENSLLKMYDYANPYKNNNQPIQMPPGSRYIPHFSPSALASSPTDSTASNETMKTQGTSQEDCGYVSQSSTTSVKSMDPGIQRINEYYGRFDYRYRPVIKSSPNSRKSSVNTNNSVDLKEKKDIDVRQFLQMWNEGDEENIESKSNKEPAQKNSLDINYLSKQHEAMTNQEQLYVLGSVNVSSEDLSKYQHIQRVSKLPENIKGYTNIELLDQFEEVIESSNINNTKNYSMLSKGILGKQTILTRPRPVSPLDVEAKISQSIIHKEVGCNFEIKPCSPKMLNVEMAAPVHNILTERAIEKVTNPLSAVIGSSMVSGVEEDINEYKVKNKMLISTEEISSCKMKNTQFSVNSINSIKNSYSVQDLESNLGVCLASLPRLDNDMELNFPEVNQQFINANKGEAITSMSMKDLPGFDALDQSDKSIPIKMLTTERKILEDYPNKSTSEKEVKKLSQYRKTKSCDPESKTVKPNPVVLRTDSVIIKNPDNTKSSNTYKDEDQKTPINLTSQSEMAIVNELLLCRNKSFNQDQNFLINDNAIDFTLNKSNHKYFSCNDYELESKPLENILLHKDALQNDNASKDNSSISNCDESNLIVNTGAIFTYTNITTKSKKSESIFDLPSEEVCLSYNIDKNIKINSKQSNVCELIEPRMSISGCLDTEKTDDDIINDICIPKADTKINEPQTGYTVQNKSEKQIPSNSLIEKPLQEKSLPKLVGDESILVESSLGENFAFDNEESKKFNQIPLGNTNPDQSNLQSKTETSQSGIIIDDKLEESEMLDTKREAHINVLMDMKSDNIINNDTEVSKIHEQSNCKKVSLIQDKENVVCCDLDKSSETNVEKLQTESWISENSCNNVIVNETSNSSDDGMLLSEIDKSPCQDHVYPISFLENVESEFHCYDPLDLYADSKVNTSLINYRSNIKYTGKKLHSPWIYKLLIYIEGPCNPVISSIKLPSIKAPIDKESETKTIDDIYLNTKNIFNAENNDIVMNNDCVNYNSNSSVKEKATKLTEVQCDNSHITTKKTDELFINTTVDHLNNEENITTQKALGLDCKHPNTVTATGKNSENEEHFLQSETSTQDMTLSVKKISTSLGIKKQNDNECENKQDLACSNSWNSKNFNKMRSNFMNQPHASLKRSVSDSAINKICTNFHNYQDSNSSTSLNWTFKRRKTNYIDHTNDSIPITQKLCNMLQSRRNSISSYYNNDNISFCILIDDNCIIAEEDEDADKIHTGYTEDFLEITDNLINKEEETSVTEKLEIACLEDKSSDYSESFMLECNQEKVFGDPWVQDVACIETVGSHDVAEDIVISALSSPKNYCMSDNEESGIYGSDLSDHTEKVKYIYGDKMCSDDAHFVETLYNTPQMDVNKTLITRETHVFEPCNMFYDTASLERILSESNSHSGTHGMLEHTDSLFSSSESLCHKSPNNKENISNMASPGYLSENDKPVECDMVNLKTFKNTQDDTVHSCESSNDNMFSYKNGDEIINYTTSRSPEVSSTTSEERNSSILLKITNYKGSITSHINQVRVNSNVSCCKFTEKNDYLHSNAVLNSTRPLLTKAAQKYIPPIKESFHDLKVKLPLPENSLLKLKQLKQSKDKPKDPVCIKNITVIPKKLKPKFEDVLKSIDEIQFKRHKEKKKSKRVIPKVVIKKNENGSHYASTSNQDTYNPDLTGRKWQPWVFLEKSSFIDKMALKKKNKAIFNYRKNTYVLAEKFYKYKSVNSTKFFITPQKVNASSTGQLKYTIRLKHN